MTSIRETNGTKYDGTAAGNNQCGRGDPGLHDTNSDGDPAGVPDAGSVVSHGCGDADDGIFLSAAAWGNPAGITVSSAKAVLSRR